MRARTWALVFLLCEAVFAGVATSQGVGAAGHSGALGSVVNRAASQPTEATSAGETNQTNQTNQSSPSDGAKESGKTGEEGKGPRGAQGAMAAIMGELARRLEDIHNQQQEMHTELLKLKTSDPATAEYDRIQQREREAQNARWHLLRQQQQRQQPTLQANVSGEGAEQQLQGKQDLASSPQQAVVAKQMQTLLRLSVKGASGSGIFLAILEWLSISVAMFLLTMHHVTIVGKDGGNPFCIQDYPALLAGVVVVSIHFGLTLGRSRDGHNPSGALWVTTLLSLVLNVLAWGAKFFVGEDTPESVMSPSQVSTEQGTQKLERGINTPNTPNTQTQVTTASGAQQPNEVSKIMAGVADSISHPALKDNMPMVAMWLVATVVGLVAILLTFDLLAIILPALLFPIVIKDLHTFSPWLSTLPAPAIKFASTEEVAPGILVLIPPGVAVLLGVLALGQRGGGNDVVADMFLSVSLGLTLASVLYMGAMRRALDFKGVKVQDLMFSCKFVSEQ